MSYRDGVHLKSLVEKMKLKNLTPELDIEEIYLTVPEVNRPALQLAGFFDIFDTDRPQLIGHVEYVYLEKLTKDERLKRYRQVFEHDITCLIYSRGLEPEKEVIELGRVNNIPIFTVHQYTSSFIAEVIRWLNEQLAPRKVIHGVMVDVYGEGVLITGESGIGKSEAALELIKRGHRLVTDDAVEIRRISDDTLIGSAPDVTKYFMELRGIGIINVKNLFGVQSVLESQKIDLEIKLTEWEDHNEYDRMGLEEEFVEILGNRIISYEIPVRPGRNLAVIIEAAAINHRQKGMGYNAASELYKRIQNIGYDEK